MFQTSLNEIPVPVDRLDREQLSLLDDLSRLGLAVWPRAFLLPSLSLSRALLVAVVGQESLFPRRTLSKFITSTWVVRVCLAAKLSLFAGGG